MIPSKQKKINEYLAKKILQRYSHEYSNLECGDKPDLYDEKSSFGVEVTSDFPDEKWKELICKRRDNICSKLDSSREVIVDHTPINTKKAIDSKLKKTYYKVNKIELFIFISDIYIIDAWVSDMIRYWAEKQENSLTKYDRLFLYSAASEMLWVCERETQQWLRKKFPDHFCCDIYRALERQR